VTQCRKQEKIAEQLGLPVRTVETRIFRAVKILREKLKEQLVLLFQILFSKN
jgi:DNA-directed RNA polymerase specialized sigma24 family protein